MVLDQNFLSVLFHNLLEIEKYGMALWKHAYVIQGPVNSFVATQ